jgi:hypothetical protein
MEHLLYLPALVGEIASWQVTFGIITALCAAAAVTISLVGLSLARKGFQKRGLQ